jgi:hypothetical protein
MLRWARSSDIPNQFSGAKKFGDVSPEQLQKIKDGLVVNQCWANRFDSHTGYNFTKIQELSAKIYEQQTGITRYHLVPVAKTWYPEGGGYIGWHTDNDGGRLYSAWADGESFFRYQDPITKEVITSYDKPGQWSFRVFTFDAKNPLWHCVYAKDTRVSVGFRFVKKN